MALALGKHGDQHIGPGNLIAAGALHMNNSTLNDALKTGGWLAIFIIFDNQTSQFIVDIIG